MSAKIFVVSQLPNLGELLKSALPEVDIRIVPLKEQFDWSRTLNPEVKDLVRDAEILFCDNTSVGQLMYDLPNLKWVQTVWAGVDSIFGCVDPKKPLPPFILTRYGDRRFGETMAEYLLAQIINNERLLYKMWDNQKLNKWRTEVFLNCRIISELTVGIMGTGVLGGRAALALKQRGATIHGFTRRPRKDSELGCFDRIFTDLSAFLKDCDYVCSILPSTRLTRGILNGDALKSCQKKPVFISMGRGDVIEEQDLLNALNFRNKLILEVNVYFSNRQDWISKGIIDVFKEEPLPSNSALWNHPKIIVTPHIAGSTNTQQILKCFLENYKRYCSGEELLNQVDWEQGY